jgi:hypothetical protein
MTIRRPGHDETHFVALRTRCGTAVSEVCQLHVAMKSDVQRGEAGAGAEEDEEAEEGTDDFRSQIHLA